MADDRQNASTMEQLGSLRNFMDERRGRVLPRPVGAAITTIKGLDAKVRRLEDSVAELIETNNRLYATRDSIRAEVYYKTPHSRGQFGWGLLAFVQAAHYDDDDDAWQDRKPTDGGSTTPVYNESAAVKRRAQDDAVRQQHADDPGALARAAAEYQEQHTATTAKEQTDD